MKIEDYWENRFRYIEEMSNEIGEETLKDIQLGFAKASADIQKDINKWFDRLAVNNNVSLSEAKKMLVRNDLAEFKWTVEEYVKHGKENVVDQKWLKQLENASAKWHISRLESLQIQVQNHLEVAFGNEVDLLDKGLEKVYIENYNKTLFELQKGLGIGTNVPTIDEKKLKQIIQKPWHSDGLDFSSRIWRNKDEMVQKLHQELTRTVANGKDATQLVKNLEKYVDTNIKNKNYVARRLVQTEQAVFRSKAQLEGFMELGCKEYEIVATLDRLTSNICQLMDLKHFHVDEFHIGKTAPPFHPNCRTCICPYFDDEFTEDDTRSARAEDGEVYTVPSDMNYKEWAEKFLDGGDKTGLTNVEKGGTINDISKETFENVFDEIIDNTNTIKVGDADIKAINDYVSSDSYKVNQSLRNGNKLTFEQQQFVDDLDIALAKMPTYQGDLTRSVHFNFQEQVIDFVSDFIIGEEISFKQYISTTCGEIYNPEAPILIRIINSSKGKDIREYNENEQEILYERDSVFEVVDVTETANGGIEITLWEVYYE